jgi:hypothetical protein
MKIRAFLICLSIIFAFHAGAQITTAVIKANFGVDADVRANYFNGTLQPGNDDWFNYPNTNGIGTFMIDTTGAAAIVARYATDMAFRRSSFARTMRYPAYTVVNNRTLLDAIMVRDFHGDDSTVFASGSNKNGDNPLVWSTPVSQGIPDKNDLLDMFVHVRRAGPNGTDSLWMFGGLSLDNTTGNRYFDFEMYQTDLTYNRSTLNFSGVGPSAGHTTWEFDAAGNITKAGDIIFSAEYQSSSLSLIEARIWIDKAKLSITPSAFSWGGLFDGASNGSTYGYASIKPKVTGTYYTGLQCSNGTWGGPFGIILQDDSYATDYSAKQFVEFSVNLTKLGLDPLTTLGGDPCGMPFRRILVKTRASASFTAELKDFIAPFAFFDPPSAVVGTESPWMCKEGSVTEIHVTNPLSTSVYTWSTTNGHILGSTTGVSIAVDTPGVYIVTQTLLTGCGQYATDTVEIFGYDICTTLRIGLSGLQGVAIDDDMHLNWKVADDQYTANFVIEKSLDGTNFSTIGEVHKEESGEGPAAYTFNDVDGLLTRAVIFYRLKLVMNDGSFLYSNIISYRAESSLPGNQLSIFPNPAKNIVQVQIGVSGNVKMKIDLFDVTGRFIATKFASLQHGNNIITLDCLSKEPSGVYFAVFNIGTEKVKKRIVVSR